MEAHRKQVPESITARGFALGPCPFLSVTRRGDDAGARLTAWIPPPTAPTLMHPADCAAITAAYRQHATAIARVAEMTATLSATIARVNDATATAQRVYAHAGAVVTPVLRMMERQRRTAALAHAVMTTQRNAPARRSVRCGVSRARRHGAARPTRRSSRGNGRRSPSGASGSESDPPHKPRNSRGAVAA
jgi:hypothetical protein